MHIQVEIDFQFNIGSQLTLESALPAECNVSNGALIIDGDYGFKGFRGFNFGNETQFPANLSGIYQCYADEGYRGFLSKSLSNAAGNTDITIQVTLWETIPQELFIFFDSICMEYATNMIITNSQNSSQIVINNNRPVAIIPLGTLNLVSDFNGVEVTINITNWNKPNKNIKITQVSFNYIGIYSAHDIMTMECSENLLDQQMKITAGICEQYADISIYDRNEMLHQFALHEILTDKQRIVITVIDDANNTRYTLGTFYADDWDIKSNSSVVNISCKDLMLTLEGIYISALEVETRSVHDMLTSIFVQLKNVAWRYIDTATQTYCQSIITPNSWFYTDTLLSSLVKICLLGQIRVYWHIDAFVVARCW